MGIGESRGKKATTERSLGDGDARGSRGYCVGRGRTPQDLAVAHSNKDVLGNIPQTSADPNEYQWTTYCHLNEWERTKEVKNHKALLNIKR